MVIWQSSIKNQGWYKQASEGAEPESDYGLHIQNSEAVTPRKVHANMAIPNAPMSLKGFFLVSPNIKDPGEALKALKAAISPEKIEHA